MVASKSLMASVVKNTTDILSLFRLAWNYEYRGQQIYLLSYLLNDNNFISRYISQWFI